MADIGDKTNDKPVARREITLSRRVTRREIAVRKLMGKRVSVEDNNGTYNGVISRVNKVSFSVDWHEIPYTNIRVLYLL